jgi:hypothetical protein
VSGLSRWSPGFDSSPDSMRFVMDEVAPKQVFLRILRFSPDNIISPLLCTPLYPNATLFRKPGNHETKHAASEYRGHLDRKCKVFPLLA